MPTFKQGDRVRVIARPQSANDIKENAYFPHMGGVEGTVVKVYSPEEITVSVDRETLPEQNAARHTEIEKRLQERWMDSISQEARANLSDAEKQFKLNYSVIVPANDLELVKPGKRPAKPAAEPDPRVHTQDLDRTEEEFLKSRVG
ncbi:MAG TPA: hypothetical protein VGM37_01130 [Armatimonadota bacterium]|jgi:hypothetical protein